MIMGNEENEQDDAGGTEGESEFEKLYSESLKSFQKGTIVRGRILRVQTNAVILDLGFKSDGIIPIEQFSPDEISALKAGDELEVYIDEAEDSRGNLVLSRDKARKLQAWDDLNLAYQNGTPIRGKIIGKIKGGLTVDIGVPAFLPGSQIDSRPVKDLDRYIGQSLEMKIIKMNSGRGNIVMSRRAILDSEMKLQREKLAATLAEGAVVSGTVKNITDYGAFVDLGGIDGLIHVTDMSWGRIGHPSEVIKPGDRILAKVLKFDREKQKISLGLKQTTDDP
ncbi:MAG: S1 RNA-binding domain-containing protein, partial [Nitrospiraceae bacterium]|nr:S1 RNA-binding domain-containing protein [Nitrospiraceae bacterium]